jgi:hypothetical protein
MGPYRAQLFGGQAFPAFRFAPCRAILVRSLREWRPGFLVTSKVILKCFNDLDLFDVPLSFGSCFVLNGRLRFVVSHPFTKNVKGWGTQRGWRGRIWEFGFL